VIVVVEPHADDAFLSLHGHMLRWRKAGVEVRIVTVYGDDRRMDEAAAYAASIGATHCPIGVPEGGMGNGVRWEAEPLPDLRLRGDVLIFPLGVQHPEHRTTAAAAPAGAYRYVEQPYALTTANAEEVAAKAFGRPVLSWLRPNGSKYARARLFRTQAMFFHRNLDRLRSAPEVVLG
jgi:hypothetical protein